MNDCLQKQFIISDLAQSPLEQLISKKALKFVLRDNYFPDISNDF